MERRGWEGEEESKKPVGLLGSSEEAMGGEELKLEKEKVKKKKGVKLKHGGLWSVDCGGVYKLHKLQITITAEDEDEGKR